MIQTFSQKLIVVLSVITLLAVIGYFIFTSTDIPITPADLSGQGAVGEDILILADKVNSINIDKTVLTSTVFQSLVDRQIPLSPEEQGRLNPFAVIGFQIGVGAKSPTLQQPR